MQVNVVYKFGGSSVRDPERMREVADIISSFPENLPCVVLSAMGKVHPASIPCVVLVTFWHGVASVQPCHWLPVASVLNLPSAICRQQTCCCHLESWP